MVLITSPWHTEELRGEKWIQSHLEYRRWRMNKLDQTQVRGTIKAYLMVIRAVKHEYFSALIASAYNCPVTLFKVNCFLLGKEDTEVYLQGRSVAFANFLEDKVAWIHSQLGNGMAAGLMRQIIWEQFELEEVSRILGSVSTTICVLDPCPS